MLQILREKNKLQTTYNTIFKDEKRPYAGRNIICTSIKDLHGATMEASWGNHRSFALPNQSVYHGNLFICLIK